MSNIHYQYKSNVDKSADEAIEYDKTSTAIARYLAFRDIPSLIRKYVKGQEALDYGAGTGISTELLVRLGFHVTGVDVDEKMLEEARNRCPLTKFSLINKDGSLPVKKNSQDLIFSSLVLFELPSKEKIVGYLKEARKSLKKDGVLIALTGSENMYSGDWLSFETDFECNKNPKSGDAVKIYLPAEGIEFTDFYWTENEYKDCLRKAGFEILEVIHPLGDRNEPYPWKGELVDSPYVIFVARPKCN